MSSGDDFLSQSEYFNLYPLGVTHCNVDATFLRLWMGTLEQVSLTIGVHRSTA